VGDYIEIGEIGGDVVRIGMRNTTLRSYFGQTYIIPNGYIEVLTNYSSSNSFAMVEINIPYDSDILSVEKLVAKSVVVLPANYHDILDGMPAIDGGHELELSDYMS